MNSECPTCKEKTMIKVSDFYTQNLYSCYNEKCSDYGELFVFGMDKFIKIDELVEKLMDTVYE
jgi:hypothetical protein